MEKDKFIYESCDGGNTIFRRRFGSDEQEQVQIEQVENDLRWERIQVHLKRQDAEMLKWEQDGYYDQFTKEAETENKNNMTPKDQKVPCFYQLQP